MKFEDYLTNVNKANEKNIERINGLINEVQQKTQERDAAQEAKECILSVVKTLVNLVKSNSIIYNIVKKWDVWQEIEKLIEE